VSEQGEETVPGLGLSNDNPWPGLNAFDEGSAEFFLENQVLERVRCSAQGYFQ
jgi:hypothetical protein